MLDRIARQVVNVGKSWAGQRQLGTAWTRLEFTNCLLDNRPLCPRMRRFLKYVIRVNPVLDSGKQPSLCLFVITCQEEGKLIKTSQVLSESLEKFLASYLPCLVSDGISGKPSHLVFSLTLLRRPLASCLKICFTKTPRQRNFAPSFISASRTPSPSWLIPVKFFTSITSPRHNQDPFRPFRKQSPALCTGREEFSLPDPMPIF